MEKDTVEELEQLLNEKPMGWDQRARTLAIKLLHGFEQGSTERFVSATIAQLKKR